MERWRSGVVGLLARLFVRSFGRSVSLDRSFVGLEGQLDWLGSTRALVLCVCFVDCFQAGPVCLWGRLFLGSPSLSCFGSCFVVGLIVWVAGGEGGEVRLFLALSGARRKREGGREGC